MDAQAQRAEFWTDLASAARALVSQPSVPLFSIGAMLLSAAMPTSGQHSAVVWLEVMIEFASLFFLLGWYGAERVFFQRHLEGKPVTLRHLLRLAIPFAGRFIALGLLCVIVLGIPLFAAESAFGWQDQKPAWFAVSLSVLAVAGDFALTFVTPALAYTTRSAVGALGIGLAMIRQTWPRSALYVLCPPLALNVLHLIHPTSRVGLQLALTVLVVVVSLLAKGAIAAFYLRERGSYSDDGAAYIPAEGKAARAAEASRAGTSGAHQDDRIAGGLAVGAPRDGEVAISATVLGWTLILGGVLRALFGGFQILDYGVLPLLASNAQLDAEVRASVVNSLVTLVVGAGMALVGLASGIALLRRRSWARPWIVCVSVATLCEFAWNVLRTGNPAAHAWQMFRFAPGVIGGVSLVLVIGTPVVAVLALLLLAARGQTWLPPSPLGQWVVAALVIVVSNGTVSYRLWRDDPQRRHERFEQEVAALSVEPGKGRLVIVPTFDGARLDASFETAVKLTLDEQKTKTHRQLAARYTDGVIDVPDVDTGVYGLSFGIDANAANGFGTGWGMPGDFISWGGGRWDLLRSGQTVRQEVRVYRVMRLLQPEDTGLGLARSSVVPEFGSPLIIAWEPVPGARTYGYGIVRQSPDGSRHMAGTQGPNTTWTVELPPTKPGETYALDLQAYGKTGQVGIFEVQGAGWRGWAYRFRIAEPPSK